MNTQNILKRLVSLIVVVGFTMNYSQAQMLTLENQKSQLTVFGSSNLHGWKVDAKTTHGSIGFNDLESCDITHLSIAVLTESLKGVKSGITETATETLKSDQYKYILFTLSEVTHVTAKGNGQFTVQTIGDLVIAGTSKTIPLDFNVNIKKGKVTLVGNAKLKLTSFNLTPPKALMGTIKAKDDIFLRFETNFSEPTIL
ncbi:YceI family protein [Pseudotamlana carrageenivorans]|uniref:YceI family protein n=1 Tax=Pseudotamlana carrageenivorans TaxID=2069432 RepID=A0A2I7SIK8_9FLAO|nr:YceI family protein [Tamlana carrageenivorans]AUS05731.1 YceI family protein [Tamlana carrageenivorans]